MTIEMEVAERVAVFVAEDIADVTDGEPTIPELRAEAKELGWQRVKVNEMEDRCPDCTTCVVAPRGRKGR